VQIKRIAVIGAGPSGMMAAIRASQLNQAVTLFEKNPILGRKLLLSGKGRCNITNACSLDLFLKRFSKNGEFLRGAFAKFFNQDLIDFFKDRGLELKTERQLRVFPVTDSSASVVEILKKELIKNKVEVIYKTNIRNIIIENGAVKSVVLGNGEFVPFDYVIMATGGVSYSFTGSSGDGLQIARKIGHNIIPLRAGLVPLEISEDYSKYLEGLILENIQLKFYSGKDEAVSEVGDLLFTASGISGPLVLTLSCKISDWLAQRREINLRIDLKPGLTYEQLDARFLREFKLHAKQGLKSVMKTLLPLRLINLVINMAKIAPNKKVSQITQKERKELVFLLKGWKLNIKGARPIEEGMITAGGVDLKEINPRTMESRLFKGLYFCGEMIDVDADTGGFNLQAAFSTGYLAGESAALN
jgi:hypothetical protein